MKVNHIPVSWGGRILAVEPGDRSVAMLTYHHTPGGVRFDEPRERDVEHLELLLTELRRHHPDAQPKTPPAPVQERQPTVWYVGTTVTRLNRVLPAAKHGKSVMFPHDTDPRYAYATAEEGNAWSYAERAWHITGRSPRVYQVEPLGEVEADPSHHPNGRSRNTFSGDYRCLRGWRVVRELPMPSEMGTRADWEDGA